MQFTDTQVSELKIAFNAWRAIEQIEARPFPDKDDDTFKIIAARATKYGALQGARSAWTRAAQELADEGVITLHKPAPRPVEIDQVFRNEVQQLTSSELLKRINQDPVFKQKFDALAQESSSPHQTDAEDYSTFTSHDWHAVPPNTLARLMTKPAFRARVEQLVAAGSI